jgi:tetratricopeptide (TPR) repeat protein
MVLPAYAASAQQGAILKGVVVDQDGKILAGATVTVARWSQVAAGGDINSTGGNQRSATHTDTSDDAGAFTVLNLFPSVDYRVRVEMEGYVPREQRMNLRVAANDMGNVMLISGDVEKARNAYQKGYEAYSQGRLMEAMEPMEEVAEVYGDSDSSDEMLVVALGVLGQGYLQQNRVPEAKARLERLLSIQPESGIALRGLGQVNAMSGQMGAAIEQFELAVTVDPDNANGHFLLGYTLHLSGRAAEAVPHLRTSLELEPTFLRAQSTLGMALADAGDNAGAIEQLEAYLAAAPNAPDAAQVQAKIAELKR